MKPQDNFQQQKQKQLSKSDNSNIGQWDKKIILLCNKINKNKNYCTTSSCSGRIVLLKTSDKKMENAFLFRTHDKISFKKFKKILEKIKENFNGLAEFQMTPCILHVACKTLGDARDIVTKARLAGWKRSGIMSLGKNKRFVVELHSTESVSFPIMNKSQILINDKFLKIVVEQANNKLEKVWKKIERLKNSL